MTNDKVVEFNDANLDTTILKSNIPVIVSFWASNCGPCRTLAPHWEALAKEYEGLAILGSVNVDECPRAVKNFRIMHVPTIAITVDGITEKRIVGLKPIDELRSIIDTFVRRNEVGESDSEQDA